MGKKFQYDENGGTFFYFLLSFLALILVPATLYYWPRRKKRDAEEEEKGCQCPGCVEKRDFLRKNEPWKGPRNFVIKLVIIGGWGLLILLAYKVSQFDYEMANFDPYEILGVEVDASQADIKKAYRKLSLILHPDKDSGNEQEFMKLSKAYQALTEEEARKNWERYGNPDGPSAMSFGIALPSWIVEKKNSVWVLGLYALVFMVALPVVVGTWWNRSIKFTGDQVLLETTRLYYYFFHKTPIMPMKKVISILGASLEFDPEHNSEISKIQENQQPIIAQLIKKIGNLGEKCREIPLCYQYSVKARALIYAHLRHIPLPDETLKKDARYIIKKCPYLIMEQVNCVNHIILLAYARKVENLPNISTIENCMKLSAMIVQGVDVLKSPFLQLPYITEENIKYFTIKKRPLKNLQQFAQLKGETRRSILRSLTDEQYGHVMQVLGGMPFVDFQVQCEVMDDDNPTEVTQSAIVTVTVTLTRSDMSTVFGDDSVVKEAPENEAESANDAEKRPIWLKQKRGGNKKSKKTTKKVPLVKPGKKEQSPAPEAEATVAASPPEKHSSDSSDSESEDKSSEEKSTTNNDEAQDDQEWEKFQKIHERGKSLEGRSKASHSVHCPYFPTDKQEYWWTYICDRKSNTLLTAPYHITSLVDQQQVHLRFTAPQWVGVFNITVCLRSDSYVSFDQQKDIKLDVKQAPAMETEHPQWEFGDSDEEGPAVDAAQESEYTTDEDLPEDD